MLDNRTALKDEYKLILENTTYEIKKEVGRGSTCIVYQGNYYDKMDAVHPVRIKEFFPCQINIKRKEMGALEISEHCKKQFSAEKERFLKSYQQNVHMKNKLGLTNSTIDAINICEQNNTLYIVEAMIEGYTYEKQTDETLQDVFIRVLAIVKVIEKYHQFNFLHLDIKPENILIIPETKEHVVLFDFDSIISMDKLKDNTVSLFCSDNYAAPELVSKDRDKIGPSTDIYSIGAIVFERIFGETPSIRDGSIYKTYDFTQMIFKDDRYLLRPRLLREISKFLHKTIASSLSYRFKCMKPVIQQLEILIELSDIEDMDLCSDFADSYSFAGFVGRTEEIQSIDESFKHEHVLFLSGVGGIGKTELAKYYAYKYQKNYNRIVFLTFQGSIENTIIAQDLKINKIQKEEEEDDSTFFKRKLNCLKIVTKPDDLIIIDNFDVSYDENLEALFACKCRFLITTREKFEKFRDYNYSQLEITEMKQLEDLKEIFRYYNPIKYESYEIFFIQEIIKWVDCHTMTVALIAKYLRDTKEQPSDFLSKLKKKEGITNTSETKIRQRKENKLQEESITQHLLILFDLSKFTQKEYELIRSLSLLGYIKISKTKFLEYCNFDHASIPLEHLIENGWIEFDKSTNKISLHQIILDLVYNNLKPTSSNCPHIMDSMAEYLEQDLPNYTEKDVRRRLMKLFMERVNGKDLRYVKFCIDYCEFIENKMEYLESAEEICLSIQKNICSYFLQRIYQLKIKALSSEGHMDHMAYEFCENDDVEFEELFKLDSKNMCKYAQKAYFYAKEYTFKPAYLGIFCTELTFEIEETLVNMLTLVNEEQVSKEINGIFDILVKLLEDAEQYILKSDLSSSKKEILFLKMAKFFDIYGITDFYADFYLGFSRDVQDISLINFYKGENYGDARKTIYYLEVSEFFRHSENAQNINFPTKEEAFSSYYKRATEFYEKHEFADEYFLSSEKREQNEFEREIEEDKQSEESLFPNLDEFDQEIEENKKRNHYLLAKKDAAGKDAETQIEIWNHAAYEYGYFDEYEMEEKCYSQLFKIASPILNQQEYIMFPQYFSIAVMQLKCYKNLEKPEIIKQRVWDLYNKMIDYFFNIAKKEEIHDRARTFSKNLCECADYLNEAACKKEAVLFYVISIIAAVNTNLSKEWFSSIFQDTTDIKNKLSMEFSKTLHQKEISNQNIDIVINISRMLNPLLELDIKFEDFKKELQWFSDNYQYHDIVFKKSNTP